MGFLSLIDAKCDLNKYKQLWLLSVLRTAKRVAPPGQGASKCLVVGDRAWLSLGRQGRVVPAALPRDAGMPQQTQLASELQITPPPISGTSWRLREASRACCWYHGRASSPAAGSRQDRAELGETLQPPSPCPAPDD